MSSLTMSPETSGVEEVRERVREGLGGVSNSRLEGSGEGHTAVFQTCVSATHRRGS